MQSTLKTVRHVFLHSDFCIQNDTRSSLCSERVHQPTLDIMRAIDVASGIATSRSFDKYSDFVLDTRNISPIIYIWYEGGWLSPPVVTAAWFVGGWVANPEEKTMAKKAAKGAKKKAAKKR